MVQKVILDLDDLVKIADAIREQIDSENKMRFKQMPDLISGIAVDGTLYLLEDEEGNQAYATMIGDTPVDITATENDIRLGTTALTSTGLTTGTKDIPAYRTYTCRRAVLPNESFSIASLSNYDLYDYTELQCIIAKFNTTLDDSVAADKIVLNDQVFLTGSTEALSNVSKNSDLKSIDLNILNDSEDIYIIHAFMFREEV